MNTTKKPFRSQAGPAPREGGMAARWVGLALLFLGLNVWTARAAVSVSPGITSTGSNVVQTLNITTNIVTTEYVTYDFVNNAYITNEYVNISYITNVTIKKATINQLFTQNTYFTTNAFPGPSGAFDFTNSYQYYQASGNVTVSGLTSVSNNFVNLGMLMVSNITGSPITLTVSVANAVPIGQQTVSPLTIPGNKKAWVKFLAYGNVFTNYACDLDDGTLATIAYVNTSTNGFATTAYAKTFTMQTNNPGGAALVFGGGTTAATLYDTNITAATTLKLFDITQTPSTGSAIKLYCTASGADRILTFPAGCSGAGLGTPPAVTITNAKGAWFDIIYKPGAVPVTNVFWSPVY